jgi:amidophosphoribosyltransferase
LSSAAAAKRTPSGIFARPETALADSGLAHDWRSETDMCGVFGIRSEGRDVSRLAYFGLFALQHRGQESAGIAVSDGGP